MGGQEFQRASSSSVDLGLSTHGPRTMKALWKEKTAEAMTPAVPYQGVHGQGLYESMKEHGYRADYEGAEWDKPTLHVRPSGELTQGEGHHRIAAAAQIERESGGRRSIWLPVRYEKAYR